MDRKFAASMAETIAESNLATQRDAEISRVTSSTEDEGRFVPGTLLGGRYRIIALLGRGGMGEVYRATDLTLGQSVALKFLPEEASRNQRLLERFHGEVRVARLVSHPNVCRVYDIGEVEGMPFISMEYIDGEDLASLLTRIGRLPADKAIEAARKICAGLAAAHDRGVIHRDLKPQNIMMNKRGEVVIMDFGLAAIADQLSGPEARNGTPAYMSPEQLRGEAVTSKSDIYALGLVLYEIFTGKRPYDAGTVQQLIDMQQSMHLTSVISVATDVDPVVEKVIRRCLDPDPMKRPGNALAVVAALPGGDPLAAALAAGETPSPEMVAGAGAVHGMPRRYTIPLLGVVAVCLLAMPVLRQSRTAILQTPLDRSPAVLSQDSRAYAAQFGFTDRPIDRWVTLEQRTELIGYLQALPVPHRWTEWLSADSPLRAMYRESPRPLNAYPDGQVNVNNPPVLAPGMVEVIVDGNGRLLDFEALPNDALPPWSRIITPDEVFRAARLDIANFREIDPVGVPPQAFETRRMWTGPHPQLPATKLRMDIAWWKGRVVRARLYYPWVTDAAAVARPRTIGAQLRDNSLLIMEFVGGFFIVLLARHNWKRERADVRGAALIAAARFVLAAIAWIGVTHPADNGSFIDHATSACGDWLLSAAIMFVVYLALEPAVRARWPHSIVTWNRVLAGRWGDAQVASDVLLGCAAGAGIWIAFKLLGFALSSGGEPVATDFPLFATLGSRQWIGAHATVLGNALKMGVLIFMAIYGLRRILRKDWLAILAAAALFTMAENPPSQEPHWQVITVIYVVAYALLVVLLLRSGLVATMTTLFTANCFNLITVGADWKAWHAAPGIATALLILVVAVWAFWRSLGDSELLGEGSTL